MRNHIAHAFHVIVFVLTVHVWHLVTSDRLLDAYADVALDKGADIVLQVSHVMAKE
jgi:hypothetical protein